MGPLRGPLRSQGPTRASPYATPLVLAATHTKSEDTPKPTDTTSESKDTPKPTDKNTELVKEEQELEKVPEVKIGDNTQALIDREKAYTFARYDDDGYANWSGAAMQLGYNAAIISALTVGWWEAGIAAGVSTFGPQMIGPLAQGITNTYRFAGDLKDDYKRTLFVLVLSTYTGTFSTIEGDTFVLYATNNGEILDWGEDEMQSKGTITPNMVTSKQVKLHVMFTRLSKYSSVPIELLGVQCDAEMPSSTFVNKTFEQWMTAIGEADWRKAIPNVKNFKDKSTGIDIRCKPKWAKGKEPKGDTARMLNTTILVQCSMAWNISDSAAGFGLQASITNEAWGNWAVKAKNMMKDVQKDGASAIRGVITDFAQSGGGIDLFKAAHEDPTGKKLTALTNNNDMIKRFAEGMTYWRASRDVDLDVDKNSDAQSVEARGDNTTAMLLGIAALAGVYVLNK